MYWLLLFIVFAKVVEVTMATVRIVLITKGERKIGSIIAFFEVALWVILVSTVLKDVTDEPLKIVAYSLGFAIGNYLGSLVEEKLGIGVSEMQTIVKEEDGKAVTTALREAGFAVTVVKAEDKNYPREMLIMYVPRKQIHKCANIIRGVQENAVITISDKKPIYGGYGMLRK
ncbi:MAG: DUF5698 domain-containing protein [Bacillota bacterium]|nr:DUF5698 domain-containing protein [Bacillota bacterium]